MEETQRKTLALAITLPLGRVGSTGSSEEMKETKENGHQMKRRRKKEEWANALN